MGLSPACTLVGCDHRYKVLGAKEELLNYEQPEGLPIWLDYRSTHLRSTSDSIRPTA